MSRTQKRNPVADDGVTSMRQMFTDTGRWATQQLKRAALEGRAFSSDALRTLDTLRHEEWKYFDKVLLEEAKIRLVGVADLIAKGLTATVSNPLGKMVYAYEKINFMDEAAVTLDGRARTANDVLEFTLNQMPLPITHKDFFLNLRQLAASRNEGESLDSTSARVAARVVSEKAEKMLFQGGPTFGGLPIYGYTNFPDRITSVSFDGGKDWGDTSKVGTSFVADVLAAFRAAQAQRQYGPFTAYIPTDAGVNLGNDYNAATANIQTIIARLLQIPGLSDIRVADQLPSGNVVFVQMTPENVLWVQGEPLQTVQWDEGGGFTINFKAWQIAVPLLRSDAAGRSGIVHLNG
jgi:hypothetical protein